MAESKFQWNKSKAQINSDLGFGKKVNLFTAETCARYMNPFVPMESGILSEKFDTYADEESEYVEYNQLYAHYQYTGTNFNYSKEQHPLATSYWDKAMWLAKKGQVTSEVNAYRKRLAK